MGAESADNRVLHRAGSKKQPTIASCIVQEARISWQSRPASCRKQESADNRVLHRAGSKNQLTIASCIVQEARISWQSRPASCRKQETADNHSLFLAYRHKHWFDEERNTSLMETWWNFYLLGAHIPEVWPFPKTLRICSAAKEFDENPLQQSQTIIRWFYERVSWKKRATFFPFWFGNFLLWRVLKKVDSWAG